MAATLKSVKVKLDLPFIGSVEGSWEASEAEQKAAWEMYVELITRISVVELKPSEGLLREALSSLHSLFGSTRQVMKHYGPEIGRPSKKGNLSFGYLAVAILNTVLRPLLAYWHPELTSYESTRPATVSVKEHEHAWAKSTALRNELNRTRKILIAYANLLAEVAGVPTLTVSTDDGAGLIPAHRNPA